MNQTEQEILEVTQAVASTIENPSVSNIVTDMELAIKLVKEFKAAIANFHPSVLAFIKKAL